MDELCIFKLELSNDIPDVPNNTPKTSNLYPISEMLPIKYQIYKMKKKQEAPLNIITSKSPISSSPLITRITSYINNRNITTFKKRTHNNKITNTY